MGSRSGGAGRAGRGMPVHLNVAMNLRLGLDRRQEGVLTRLIDSGGSVGVADIPEVLAGRTQRRITHEGARALNDLEAKKLIDTRTGVVGPRGFLVQITDLGREVMNIG